MFTSKMVPKLLSFGAMALMVFPTLALARTDTPGGVILSLGLVGQSTAKQLSEENFTDEFNLGGAALAEIAMGQYFGVETGVLYVNRQYDAGSGSLRLIQEVKRLHVPIMAKVWLTDFFSLGVGPYVSLRVGTTKNAVQIGDIEGSLETSANRDLEIGYELSGLANLAINNKTGIFVQGRYSAPFDKKTNESASQLFGLVGVKLHLY